MIVASILHLIVLIIITLVFSNLYFIIIIMLKVNVYFSLIKNRECAKLFFLMEERILFLFLISISLGMDCFAVSCAIAFKEKIVSYKNVIKMSSFFCLFQMIMPLIGFTIGKFSYKWVKEIDHWIAFFILFIIGIKMILESLEEDEKFKDKNYFKLKFLFTLSLATSFDAFGVGFTLSILGYGLIFPVLLFGLTTFVITILGFTLGKKLKHYFGKKIEIFGGLILILIGIKILFEHLNIF